MTAPLLPSASAPLHPGTLAPPPLRPSAPRHILVTGAGFTDLSSWGEGWEYDR